MSTESRAWFQESIDYLPGDEAMHPVVLRSGAVVTKGTYTTVSELLAQGFSVRVDKRGRVVVEPPFGFNQDALELLNSCPNEVSDCLSSIELVQ